MKDKWQEHTAFMKSDEQLEEELEEDGVSVEEAEKEHFGED